jgi:hypothetical protein
MDNKELIAAAGLSLSLTVAFTQYYWQRRQYNQAIFDKRFKLFTASQHFLTTVLQNHGLLGDHVSVFLGETASAEFLYRPEIPAALAEMVRRSLDLGVVAHEIAVHVKKVEQFKSGEINEVQPGEEWFQNRLKDKQERIGWFIERQQTLTTLFKPYLGIHKEGWWPIRCGRRINRWVDEIPAKLETRYQRKSSE